MEWMLFNTARCEWFFFPFLLSVICHTPPLKSQMRAQFTPLFLLHPRSCFIPSHTHVSKQMSVENRCFMHAQEAAEHVDDGKKLEIICSKCTWIKFHFLPDLLPSFSFSSCPSSRNSRRRARWRHRGGRPAPPALPAARVTSRQPGDKTGSSGCKRSSPPSGDGGGDIKMFNRRDKLVGVKIPKIF